MPFEEFTKKILEKFDISFDAMKMHYTLKFNPRVIQDLEDEDDLMTWFPIVMTLQMLYLVDLPYVEAIEANISNTELAIRSTCDVPSSNASCDAIPNTMMLSRGSGHTFKNAEEFCNAIYQMSLGGRLREINPNTIAEYTSHEGHFMQLFIAHAFSIQGFIMGCQLVLAIDSCHLSGPYKGALSSSIAYDADDGMFPLALGVVSSENYEDWKSCILYQHVKEKFSSFLNKQNIRGKKGKEDALLLLDNIAYARCLLGRLFGCRYQSTYVYLHDMENVRLAMFTRQFQPLPTHNMSKVCDDGSLQDCAGDFFPTLQPSHMRRHPGRPSQRRIESQFSHKRAIHCSRCNDIGHNRSTPLL
ncbi:hypothetical protein CK203_112537 [Vitis vinifera]|uniref:MULE transposase domain-containing protein n=1 Tax=Vitis vinifera TaxID=29760 RepID=A0A438CPH9_VITVI|nr:hypothetical protein CK203_112537 [Vitis vinifera]